MCVRVCVCVCVCVQKGIYIVNILYIVYTIYPYNWDSEECPYVIIYPIGAPFGAPPRPSAPSAPKCATFESWKFENFEIGTTGRWDENLKILKNTFSIVYIEQ